MINIKTLIVLQTACFAEGTMWQQEVQGKAACTIRKVDEMLQPRQPFLAGLRYLSLLYEGRKQDAKGIVAMKRGRKKSEADLERDYYPHMLKIFQVLAANIMSLPHVCYAYYCSDCCWACEPQCFASSCWPQHDYLHVQAAAVGQPEIQFQLEDAASADSARPDLRCFVNGVESHPGEAKARNVSSNPITDPDGIHNREAFGKVSRGVAFPLLAWSWLVVWHCVWLSACLCLQW